MKTSSYNYNHLRNGGYVHQLSSLALHSLRTIMDLKIRLCDDTIYSPMWLVVGLVNFPPLHVAILKVKSYVCLRFGILNVKKFLVELPVI